MQYFEELMYRDFMKNRMTEEGREGLKSMVEESVDCFMSVVTKHPLFDKSMLQILVDLMAIESCITHHSISRQQHTDESHIIAHSCAEIVLRDWIRDYKRELTLKENFELWKMKKL